MAGRTFKVILIKPSHYDADGYVIQWWRSLVPSNSLASMYGLMAECAAAKSLGITREGLHKKLRAFGL